MVPSSSVEELVGGLDAGRRRDVDALCALMEDVTGEPATLWGSSIIGFGRARYRYASGREGETPLASFASRKRELVVYLAESLDDEDLRRLDALGPHRRGTACLYLRSLADVDLDVLRDVVHASARARRDADPTASRG